MDTPTHQHLHTPSLCLFHPHPPSGPSCLLWDCPEVPPCSSTNPINQSQLPILPLRRTSKTDSVCWSARSSKRTLFLRRLATHRRREITTPVGLASLCASALLQMGALQGRMSIGTFLRRVELSSVHQPRGIFTFFTNCWKVEARSKIPCCLMAMHQTMNTSIKAGGRLTG
ncbi:hypothetical protein BC834DRAFT_65174 [Gloeopeniophorella convolvens]|nr:hypothetical protein BC834DRAFT_65174 [Gloeopeniophorella convolvens]